MLQKLPTRNLHNPHAATRHKHGRAVSQHRGVVKSVAPTDFPMSQWRTIHRIRQNRLRGCVVGCVRCMQGSVRYYKFHLHASYTPHTLPHGTSTGGEYYSIGEQKCLLLRQNSLRPCGVKPTAYVYADCATEGRGV